MARVTSSLKCARMRRHVDEIALVSLWMVHSGHAKEVAQITYSLVDSGGLALACQVKNGMVVLGEALAGSPCHELVRCAAHPQAKKAVRWLIDLIGLQSPGP